MKLITLNTWGGKIFDPLIDFVKNSRSTTDIFCFQEVFSTTSTVTQEKDVHVNLFQELQKILSNFHAFFHANQDQWVFGSHVKYPVSHGIATFIKHSVEITDEGDFFIHQTKDSFPGNNDYLHFPRNAGYVTIRSHDISYTLCNIHGIGMYAPKTDIPERIAQSEKIKEFVQKQHKPVILAGDFNLLPNTQSIKIIEDTGLINVVKEHTVVTTRSKWYEWDDKFADYIFVSPEIQVYKFEVLPDTVSDHLPLFIEFA